MQFVIGRYGWEIEQATAELNALDARGLAYLDVDLRMARRRQQPETYDPYAWMKS